MSIGGKIEIAIVGYKGKRLISKSIDNRAKVGRFVPGATIPRRNINIRPSITAIDIRNKIKRTSIRGKRRISYRIIVAVKKEGIHLRPFISCLRSRENLQLVGLSIIGFIF